MRGKDWFEIGFSVAMVLVWLGVATLADRTPTPTVAPPAVIDTATTDAAPRT